MIIQKQTITNFYEFITKTEEDYLNSKTAYGWNYKSNLEELSDMKCYIITNKHQSTKVMYNEPAKMIIHVNIFDGDIERILKLKEGL
jgi:hypothetical protein